MGKYRRILFVGIVVFGISFLTACTKTDVPQEKITEKKEINKIEEINEESEINVWEKGYNLPVDEEEREEAMSECKKMLESIQLIYKECDKGDSSNVVISDKTGEEMIKKLETTGYPISFYDYREMCNYEKMEDFLVQSLNGKAGKVAFYKLHTDGGIGRHKFIYDGKDMYSLFANCMWDENDTPVVTTVSYTRIKDWKYTEKGWFGYTLCVPEPPDVSEIVNGNRLLRVKPIKKEYREIAEKYLLPLGYQGNNLLYSNWDADHMSKLDYNGLYEYLYSIKHQKRFDPEQYPDGIPKEEFEALMIECLPVTADQIQKYAVSDTGYRTYAWSRLGCMNYSPDAFGTSMPEVTDIKENKDGTLSLTIDAVCEMTGSDSEISHVLIVQIRDDGSIKYLSNQVLEDGLEKVPAYQYRLR